MSDLNIVIGNNHFYVDEFIVDVIGKSAVEKIFQTFNEEYDNNSYMSFVDFGKEFGIIAVHHDDFTDEEIDVDRIWDAFFDTFDTSHLNTRELDCLEFTELATYQLK
jgi:hypothetical protein